MKHFSKNDSDAPHVDRCGIVVSAEKQLRCSVPTSGNILSEDIGFEVVEEGSSETEVTNLEITIGVD